MRKLAIALAGAAALTFTSAAQASVTVEAGTTVDVTKLLTAGDSFVIGFQGPSNTGDFTDVLDFTNTVGGSYNLSVLTDIGTSFVDFGCAGCGISLTGGSISGSLVIPLVSTANGGFTFAYDNLSLDSGEYVLTLVGNSPALGDYRGSVNFTAVPEPAVWAMMLIGFGAIGASVRRRRTRVAVPQLA